jgi:hypothetical protein
MNTTARPRQSDRSEYSLIDFGDEIPAIYHPSLCELCYNSPHLLYPAHLFFGPRPVKRRIQMKLCLSVLLVVGFCCGGVWSQSLTSNSAPVVTQKQDTTQNVEMVVRDGLLRSSVAEAISDPKLLNNSARGYTCPNNGNSCGDGCCSKDQQCCFNSKTGGHYCATKCS